MSRQRTVGFRVLAIAAMLAIVATSALVVRPTAAASSVKLTFWTWVPDIQKYQIARFKQAYPNIDVDVVNIGQGAPEYTKLRTALKAGSGAPDAVQIEFQLLPTFISDLVDLSKYGAAKVKSQFTKWTWNQVTRGTHVYAIPQDAGPMGLLYRRDIFATYKIPVPKTWADFAAAAQKLHKANSKIYLTDFPPGEPGWYTGLMWQAGSRPFKRLGTKKYAVHINDAGAKKVASYWEKLVKPGVVGSEQDFTEAWYKHLSDGTYAAWVTAAWGPVFLQSIAKNTSGKWAAADMPQWRTGGKFVTGNWGGSTTAVTKQSNHPKEAAELAMYINANRQSATDFFTKQFFWPVLNPIIKAKMLLDQQFPFYNNQKVGRVFAKASKHVDLGFQWSPFQDYVYQQLGDAFGDAVNGKISFTQALDQVQNKVVQFAKIQGYDVQG